jgi:hypothetical protein
VARRLLLTTAGTWNLLLPPIAMAAVSRKWTGCEVALSGALAVTMAQLLFASDNQRVVAAGYPFVLAWTALYLDTLSERDRRRAGVVLVLAQIPWLLEMGRIWPVPSPDGELPHFPMIRFAEIGILFLTAAAAIHALRHRIARPQAAV